jgi:hypothetical protein
MASLGHFQKNPLYTGQGHGHFFFWGSQSGETFAHKFSVWRGNSFSLYSCPITNHGG